MEIMSSDVYIAIAPDDSTATSTQELAADVEAGFAMFKDFEKKYSRFIQANELYQFNNASGWLEVSPELFELLELAIKYYRYTSGIFDISVYQQLIAEGYDKSFKDGALVNYQKINSNEKCSLAGLQLKNGKVYKPDGLLVEFGGLGKGYMVKKVANFLATKYRNFIVDAGGDIYFSGVDVKHGYDYWACDIENPATIGKNLATLLVSNKGVATSGINRRKWVKNNLHKNHLINPQTGQSVPENILSVTVVSDDIIFSDVLAKSLLIMGMQSGLAFCEQQKIAALFIANDLQLSISPEMHEYVWGQILH